MSEHDQIITMLKDLEARSEKLSDREIKFVDGIGIRLSDGKSPTVNEAYAVHEIWERTQ